jgi:hypothetical protein
MRTFLIILGIWLLINVLFVVIMIPPRKPRRPDRSRGLSPVPVSQNGYAFDEDEKITLRHTIIAIAMGTLFSLTPPLLEAVDDIKRLIGKWRKPPQRVEAEGDKRPLETILEDLRAREEQTSAGGTSPDEHSGPQR